MTEDIQNEDPTQTINIHELIEHNKKLQAQLTKDGEEKKSLNDKLTLLLDKQEKEEKKLIEDKRAVLLSGFKEISPELFDKHVNASLDKLETVQDTLNHLAQGKIGVNAEVRTNQVKPVEFKNQDKKKDNKPLIVGKWKNTLFDGAGQVVVQ